MMGDLARVYSFLLTNRVIETTPRSGRFRSGEKVLAEMLTNNPGMLRELSEFLEPLGFELQVWNETMAPGISRHGFVYILVRTGLSEPPCFGEARFVEILRRGDAEARDVTAVWFLHLWLLLSHLLYTGIGRGPGEVIRYNEASFSAQDLLEVVRTHIEQRRKEGPPANRQSGAVYRILTGHKGMELSRRVKNFLDGMCEAILIEELKDETGLYRQTLLGAVEFEAQFNRTIKPFLPGEDTLDTIAAVVVGDDYIQPTPNDTERGL